MVLVKCMMSWHLSEKLSSLTKRALEVIFHWFLDFCFRHFDVAVWSCGKLKNMELDLFDGRELAAVLHQDDSTSLWPRTSVSMEGRRGGWGCNI